MATPVRKYDERIEGAPRSVDPITAAPQLGPDPLAGDPRFTPANDPRITNATVVQPRGVGSGAVIAGLVIVLAIIAFFLFAPGTPQTTVPADQPATTSEPAAPAPDATAPAAPDATAPAAPDATAPAPSATEPTAPADTTTPAPESSAPAETAPATPAPTTPAPAPAQ